MRSAIPSIILFALLSGCQEKPAKESLPNIVYFIADDLGYGDLSCLGQEKFRPPECLRQRVAAGQLGRKTGQGFYTYERK